MARSVDRPNIGKGNLKDTDPQKWLYSLLVGTKRRSMELAHFTGVAVNLAYDRQKELRVLQNKLEH